MKSQIFDEPPLGIVVSDNDLSFHSKKRQEGSKISAWINEGGAHLMSMAAADCRFPSSRRPRHFRVGRVLEK